MSGPESFCFNFFHTKIRGPKFCHKGEAFIFNFFTQKLGDLLGDLNFVTTNKLSVLNFGTTKHTQDPSFFLSPKLKNRIVTVFVLRGGWQQITLRRALRCARPINKTTRSFKNNIEKGDLHFTTFTSVSGKAVHKFTHMICCSA